MSIRAYIRAHWLSTGFGTILYVCGIIIIFWNEKRAVRNGLSLDDALSEAISIDQRDKYDATLHGEVLHVSGPLHTGEPLTEPEYNIQVMAVKLRRRVQMLQWVEDTVEHIFGSAIDIMESETHPTYYYSTEWRDTIVDTSGFHMRMGHENPKTIPIASRTQIARHVSIGGYELGDRVKEKIVNWLDVSSDTRPEDPAVKLHSGFYYHCNDVFHPEVGDMRIMFSFSGLHGSQYTVIGQLRNGKIEPFESRYGMPVLIVMAGEHTAGASLKAAHYALKTSTWLVRLIGAALLLAAVTCTSTLITLIVTPLPLLWTIAPDVHERQGTGNIMLTLVLAFAITSMAWVTQRPWLGVGMMLAAISPMLFLVRSMVRYDQMPRV